MKEKKAPSPWREIMGDSYWESLGRKRLWIWIEAAASAKAHGISLQEAIFTNGTEDILFIRNKTLCFLREQYDKEKTSLEIFGEKERNLREKKKISMDALPALVAWCLTRYQSRVRAANNSRKYIGWERQKKGEAK